MGETDGDIRKVNDEQDKHDEDGGKWKGSKEGI
jgi:hypothetical protein